MHRTLTLSTIVFFLASCDRPLVAHHGSHPLERPEPPDADDNGGKTVRAISVGGSASCALLASGQVLCWGGNDYGQLGNGNNTSRPLPGDVQGLNNVARLSLGFDSACVVTRDGQAWCWGGNQFGQLGNGSTENSNIPVRADLDGVRDIGCGQYHCCALLDDGSISCWGQGLAAGTGFVTRPMPLGGLANASAVSITVGKDRLCAVLSDGTGACLGSNEYGKLGCGDDLTHAEIVLISDLANAVTIVMGDDHTCALHADGTVSCWGRNEHNLLGRSDGLDVAEYTAPVPVPGLTGIVRLAAGSDFTCAVSVDGSASCWGCNNQGQLGNRTFTSSLPSLIDDINALDIAAGQAAACAVLLSGGVACWGYNGYGQLGNGAGGTGMRSHTPVNVLWSTTP